MDKTVLQAVLAKINAAPADAAVPLSSEEAGLLDAFVAVRQKSGELNERERALLARVGRVLAAWKALSPHTEDRDRRQQWTLRRALDRALQDKHAVLNSEELYLLQSTQQSLASKAELSKADERMLRMLEETLHRYRIHQAAMDEAASSSPRSFPYGDGQAWADLIGAVPPERATPLNRLQAGDYFHGVTPAPVEFVGGCQVAMTVRTFEVTGPTHITGDVPSDVLLRVKQGSVTIEGFVTGHIVADGDIIIEGNAQGGWVVATRGSIVLHKALVGARVVAEGGAVWCTSVESAAHVYGWKGVAVHTSALSTQLAGRSVWVGEKLGGTVVEVCGPVAARAVESANQAPSVLCLQHEICSEVYGRYITDDMRAMRRTVGLHERSIESSTRLARFVRRLNQNCYRTAIFYVVGGVDAASVAAEFQDLQGLALHLDELTEIGETVARYYERVFAAGSTIGPEDVDFFTSEMAKSLAYLSQQAETMAREFQSRQHSVITQCIESCARSLRFVHKHAGTARGQTHFREVFLSHIRDWQALRAKTTKRVEDLMTRFDVPPELLERVQRESDTLDQLLQEVLFAAKSDAASGATTHAQPALIRVLLATVERNRKSIHTVQGHVDLARHEAARLRTQLAEMTVVQFADPRPGAVYVEAEQYEPGTVITTALELRQGIDGTLREVIVIGRPPENATRFVLEKNVLRRVETSSETVAAGAGA
jgi:signal transduction histidine kinase